MFTQEELRLLKILLKREMLRSYEKGEFRSKFFTMLEKVEKEIIHQEELNSIAYEQQ